ncbi:glycoside hydrolase family 3 C-terminal domain-containing protein [Gloeocapsa sp. BRSZ]
MTDDERFGLIHSLMVVVFTGEGGRRDPRVPKDVPQIAGWVKGVPRLGVPDLLLTDAGLGITNPQSGRQGDTATALPSAQMLAATFNPKLAYESGAILGREARSRNFNVVLGGGMNLARDPRHGRNFEYFSEDPWLSAVMAAETVKGVQAQNVIGMLKHVSLNSQEVNKWFLDAQIDPAAHREAEMLGFQIAIERSNPGSLMCAYNKVNGAYSCGNDPLLNGVVKGAFGYKGFIMSDWKAVYSWDYAMKGLDQHSGVQVDKQEWFVGPLRQAYNRGEFPKKRLSDMVQRILRAIYQVNADKWSGPQPQPDLAAHMASAVEVARQGTVLLKNDDILPLRPDVKTIAVIGGFATKGMLSGGGGSSLTDPVGGFALDIPLGGMGIFASLRRLTMVGPSPVSELQKHFPKAEILFNPGEMPADAAAVAKRADVVVMMGFKTESENNDNADMSLPWGQREVIEAVIEANPNTVVVLQTGNPVEMPWRDKARGIVQSWYSGNVGGRVIPEVLAGKVNPSGRLPMSFYANVEQTPHPRIPGFGTPNNTPTVIEYHEGAEVGYRWLAKTGAKPNYAFGHGLSYTNFSYSNLKVSGGETISASFMVTNTGKRAGADVPQLYLTNAAGEKRMRLLGFERVQLKPGESRQVKVSADPRLLARFDGSAGRWRMTTGNYQVALGKSAADFVLAAEAPLKARLFGK